MMRHVDILDVTIRDGSYAINYQYTPTQVGAIARELDKASIPFIEVSHGCGLGARENVGMPALASDPEYVAAAKRSVTRAKIGVIASAQPNTQKEQIDAVIEDVDFIRYAANVDALAGIREHIDYTVGRGVDVFVQIMRTSRRPPQDIISAALEAEAMGAKLVYIVDTVGYFLPDELRGIIARIKEKLSIRLGFHAHNNLGLALANTLAAVDAGCDVVDASLRGMGRSSGNAQLEVLVSLMKRRGLAAAIDLDVLIAAGERLIAPIMPAQRGIEPIDLVMADANVDLYPLTFYEMIAKEVGVDLHTLVRELATYDDVVEINIPQIRRAIARFGGDPDEVFDRMGVRIPVKR